MLALARELGTRADWLFVYIAEAHAADEWPIASSRFNGARGAVHLAQTRTLASRRAAAAAFARDFGLLSESSTTSSSNGSGSSNSSSTTMSGSSSSSGGAAVTVCVDDPERGEPFAEAFAPWPVRLFVLQKGKRGGGPRRGNGDGASLNDDECAATDAAATRAAAGAGGAAVAEPARVRFLSAPRNGGFIDLEPFADALRCAAADPL